MTDKVKINMKPTDFFATPKDLDSLMKQLELYSGSEGVVAMTAAMMTWNLCCKIVSDNEKLNEESSDAS